MLLRSYEVAPDGDENEQELQPPAVSRLDEIDAPVLVLIGDQDRPDILAIAEMLSEQLPNAEKTVIPETAHLPNLERTDLFTERVLDFADVRSSART